MKEIHFYTNLCNVEQVSDWDLETMQTDWYGSVQAINDPENNIVKTTQLYLLTNAWDYIDKGIRVFIHNGSSTLEVKEHMDGTVSGKDIRYGHSICKILCSGGFGEIL